MQEKSGFTLIELILVTVIIGILAGAVTLSFRGRGEETRKTRARHDVEQLMNAIDMYAIDHHDQYPKTLNDLIAGERKYLRKMQKDPWGTDYVYKSPGAHDVYDILSCGPDRAPNTPDDITSWGTDEENPEKK